jgi:hypothetical protein
MPNELPLPEDLMRLIEKREGEDRRKHKKRKTEAGKPQSSHEGQAKSERRQTPRRQDDAPNP